MKTSQQERVDCDAANSEEITILNRVRYCESIDVLNVEMGTRRLACMASIMLFARRWTLNRVY